MRSNGKEVVICKMFKKTFEQRLDHFSNLTCIKKYKLFFRTDDDVDVLTNCCSDGKNKNT